MHTNIIGCQVKGDGHTKDRKRARSCIDSNSSISDMSVDIMRLYWLVPVFGSTNLYHQTNSNITASVERCLQIPA